MKELGEHLKETRIKHGVSLEEAASDLNVSTDLLENLESANTKAFKDVYDIKKIIRRFSIGSHVYIVFDTDKSLSESEISRFIRNITFISNQPGLFIHLLQQTKNLEDELGSVEN